MADLRTRWIESGRLPDDGLAGTVRAFAETLEERFSEAEGTVKWSDWTAISPLPRNVEEELESDELEEALSDWLPHLQEVCREPTFRLESTVERQPVHRARHISPKAIAHLAAHPEDWEQRKLRTVRPSHVLARRNQVNLNTYENRVVARLIDGLAEYLSRRVSRLGRLRGLFEEAWRFSDRVQGTHWLQGRVTELWGAAVEADEMYVKLDERWRELRNLLAQVARLRESALYRAVPRGAKVGAQLESTNVLSNDEHYRFVGKLWRVWVDLGGGTEETESPVERRRKAYDAYGTFVWLVVARALDELGWQPEGNVVPELGETVRLDGPDVETIRLTRRRDGAVEMELQSPVTKGIPLVVTPVPEQDPAALPVDDEGRIVVAMLGSDEDEDVQGDDEWPGRDACARCMADPFDLLSLERMAAAIRRWTLRRRWLGYPGRVDLPAALRAVFEGMDWLEESDGGFRVVERPERAERLGEVRSELQSTARRLALGRADRAGLPGEAERVAKELEYLIEHLQSLLRCPVCPESPKAARHGIDWGPANRTFQCRCPECRSAWGLHRCGDCGARYPVIDVGWNPEDVEDANNWFEHLGRDMLAEPVDDPDEGGRFICPECGGH